MKSIKFSEWWDKLKPKNFNLGYGLSTYRKYTPEKYAYYYAQVGQEFSVVVKGQEIGTARLNSLGEPRLHTSLTLLEIKDDTHDDWERADWNRLMTRFYGPNPTIFRLTFVIDSVTEKHEGESGGNG